MRSSSVVCESIVCKSCEAKYCEHALGYIVFRKISSIHWTSVAKSQFFSKDFRKVAG